jgi:hypothetical protein
MEKHTINIDVNTQKANLDVDKLDKNLTELDKTVENLADTMDMDLGAAISEIEDKLTQLAVQGKQNTEEFKSLAKEAGRLKSVIAEVDAQVEFFAVTNADVGQKIGLLEDQMYRMAVAGDTTSAEFRKIQAEAAALKQSVIQVDMALDGMAMTTSQKLGGALNGVTGAFGAVQGAMGAFGTESAAVNEALLKVQSAMAIQQGVQSIQEAIPAMTALKNSAVTTFQGMTAASKAFMVAGVGLLLLGIQQLVTNWEKISEALGAATAEQRINTEVTKKATESINGELNAADKLSIQLKDEQLNRKEKVRLIKEFQAAYPGLLSNINLEKDSIASINKQLGDNIQLLQLQAEAKALASVREEAYGKKAKLQLDLQSEALENATNWTITFGDSAENGFLGFNTAADNAARAQQNLSSIQNTSTKSLDRQISSLDKSEKEIQKKIKALKGLGAATGELTAEEQKAADKAKQAEEEAKRRAEQAREEAKRRAEEAAQQRKDALQKITEAQTAFDEQERTRYMTEQAKEKDAVEQKYKELYAIAEKYKQDVTKLKENEKNELNAINTKYAQEELTAEAEKQAKLAEQQKAAQEEALDAEEAFQEQYRQATTSTEQLEIDAVNEKYFQLITLAEQYGMDTTILKQNLEDEINAINKKSKDEQLKAELELNHQKADAVKNGLSTLSSLVDVFTEGNEQNQKKAFKLQKGIQIAQATVDTYKSATGAYSSLSSIPTVGPVLGALAAAAAVAAGLANIRKIQQTQFQGGGSSGGSAAYPAALPSVTTPEFNIVGGNTANQLAGLGQQPVQAYVVSNEVTTAQSLDRNRVQNATL